MTARAPSPVRSVSRLRHGLAAAAVLGVAALGFFALHRLLIEVHWSDVDNAVGRLAPGQIALSLGFAAISYFMLTFYDVMALWIIGRPLPYRTAALASFTGYTLSHNLGVAVLTGGSARYRIYGTAGLDVGDIGRIFLISSGTLWTGIAVMSGAALLAYPGVFALGRFAVSADAQRWTGAAVLALTALLLAMLRRQPWTVRLFGWAMPLPSRRQALLQIAVAAADLAAASAALFVLLPNGDPNAYPALFLGYALAVMAASLSHVPGGIGIFEAVIVAAQPGVDKASLVAALLAYRLIYYLLPLALGLTALAVHEERLWQPRARRALAAARSVATAAAPVTASALVFAGGCILLVSGSLPAVPERIRALRDLLPLPFIEASHISASLAGTGLLLLAPGLYRRLDGASLMARMLLLAGAVFSLLKGFDYEEASVLLAVTGLLQWTRGAFYRRTALIGDSLRPSWIAAVAVAVGLSVAIGFFSYKHVAYQQDLWWRFAWHGDASRFLRASFAAAVLVAAAAYWRLFRPAAQAREAAPPIPETVRRIVGRAPRTDALLALTGDKSFHCNGAGTAFLMYRIRGHSWVVMGDPVGPRDSWPDLLWQFRERVDAAQGRLLLYQLSADALAVAIDLGLQLFKYGDEARVPLEGFAMTGPSRRPLRHAERRGEREGASFDIVPAAEVPEIMNHLAEVSRQWLAAKDNAEKAFSVGRFDPDYLARCDCALIRVGGRIAAFANIWATVGREEASVDLIRYADWAPAGTMDFLFVKLLLWARDAGYGFFSLGMAPLSGLEARRLAPFWVRAGALLYRHGEALYGFEGLRAYKEKFAPVWEPRYIAGPPGLGMARALIDLQALIAGGG